MTLKATKIHLERAIQSKHDTGKELESARAEMAALTDQMRSCDLRVDEPSLRDSFPKTKSPITESSKQRGSSTAALHGVEAQKRLTQLAKEQAMAMKEEKEQLQRQGPAHKEQNLFSNLDADFNLFDFVEDSNDEARNGNFEEKGSSGLFRLRF